MATTRSTPIDPKPSEKGTWYDDLTNDPSVLGFGLNHGEMKDATELDETERYDMDAPTGDDLSMGIPMGGPKVNSGGD